MFLRYLLPEADSADAAAVLHKGRNRCTHVRVVGPHESGYRNDEMSRELGSSRRIEMKNVPFDGGDTAANKHNGARRRAGKQLNKCGGVHAATDL
jgi:hypothetical protein